MALVKCKKCGQEISTKSKRCIHCGYKSHKTLIIVIVSILVFILLITFLLVGIIFYVFKEEKKFVGSWSSVAKYYDTSTNDYICTIEFTINIKDDNTITYRSNTIDGECDYVEQNYYGTYSFEDIDLFDLNQIEATIGINGIMDDVDIIYKKDYICYDNCSNKSNYYYKDIKENNYLKEYVDYYDLKESNSNNTSDLGYIKEINYQEYLNIIKDDDESIIILGMPTCPHCKELVKNINSVITSNTDDIYYLNISNLSDTEYSSILNSLSLEDGVPIITVYDNGLKEKYQGTLSTDELKQLFIKYDILDSINNMA